MVAAIPRNVGITDALKVFGKGKFARSIAEIKLDGAITLKLLALVKAGSQKIVALMLPSLSTLLLPPYKPVEQTLQALL